jgi:hypothetical protein
VTAGLFPDEFSGPGQVPPLDIRDTLRRITEAQDALDALVAQDGHHLSGAEIGHFRHALALLDELKAVLYET